MSIVTRSLLEEALEKAIQACTQAKNFLLSSYYQAKALEQRQHLIHDIDVQAEMIIRAELMPYREDFGFRGEEQPEQNRKPVSPAHPFWLLDPNDGSSGFVEGVRGTSISLGLVDQSTGLPVLGLIWAYQMPNDKGDLFTWIQGDPCIKRNGKPWQVKAQKSLDHTSIIGISAYADQKSAFNKALVSPSQYRKAVGIAYRLALVAIGECDISCSISGTRDFDTAAGHALLLGQGYQLVNAQGEEIHYHPEMMTREAFCFGGAPELLQEFLPRFHAGKSKKDFFRDDDNHDKQPLIGMPHLLVQGEALDYIQAIFWAYSALIGFDAFSQRLHHYRKAIKLGKITFPIEQDQLLSFLICLLDQGFGQNAVEIIEKPVFFEQIQSIFIGFDRGQQMDFLYTIQQGRRNIPIAQLRKTLSFREGDQDFWTVDIDLIAEYLWCLLSTQHSSIHPLFK